MEKYLDGNDYFFGNNIDSVYEKLQQQKELGNKYQLEFNGEVINCDMSLDECYQKVVGMGYVEFHAKLKEKQDQYEKELAEHKAKIPELTEQWIKWGEENLSADVQEEWKQCVPIRLDDLYRGWELVCFKEIFNAYKANKSKEEIKEIISYQGHSGMSYGLECAIVRDFLDAELGEYLYYHD